MRLITPLRSFVTFLSVLTPAIAQVVQTGIGCSASGGSYQVSAAMTISGTAAAGTPLQLSSGLQMTTNFPYFTSTLYVLAIGVSDPWLPLSGCGCMLRTSIDWLEVQSLIINVQGAGMGLPHFGGAWAAPLVLNIPPGVSGAVLHAQGFYLASGFAPVCAEVGVSVVATESYQITVL